MNIALVFSPNWAKYVTVELYAIYKTNPAPIRVFLISDALDSDSLKAFEQVQKHFGKDYHYIYLNLEELYKQLIPSDINVSSRFTKYTLYRLMLPKILDVDRLLYIDTDAIVNADLSSFYNLEFENNLIAGVIDQGIRIPQYKSILDNIGFTVEEPYLNAGVLLFNWAEIRKLNLVDTWLKEVNTKRYGCHDQDIINMTCRGRIKVVDLAYNVSISTGLNIKLNDVKIAHYAGPKDTKPWGNNPRCPFWQIWKKWELELKKEIK